MLLPHQVSVQRSASVRNGRTTAVGDEAPPWCGLPLCEQPDVGRCRRPRGRAVVLIGQLAIALNSSAAVSERGWKPAMGADRTVAFTMPIMENCPAYDSK